MSDFIKFDNQFAHNSFMSMVRKLNLPNHDVQEIYAQIIDHMRFCKDESEFITVFTNLPVMDRLSITNSLNDEDPHFYSNEYDLHIATFELAKYLYNEFLRYGLFNISDDSFYSLMTLTDTTITIRRLIG